MEQRQMEHNTAKTYRDYCN